MVVPPTDRGQQVAPDEDPVAPELAGATVAPATALDLPVRILLVRLCGLELAEQPARRMVLERAPPGGHRPCVAREVAGRPPEVVGPDPCVGVEDRDERAPVVRGRGGAQRGALAVGQGRGAGVGACAGRRSTADHAGDVADPGPCRRRDRHGAGPVGGAVVDHDDLEARPSVRVAMVLCRQVGEQMRDHRGLVTPRDEDRGRGQRPEPSDGGVVQRRERRAAAHRRQGQRDGGEQDAERSQHGHRDDQHQRRTQGDGRDHRHHRGGTPAELRPAHPALTRRCPARSGRLPRPRSAWVARPRSTAAGWWSP